MREEREEGEEGWKRKEWKRKIKLLALKNYYEIALFLVSFFSLSLSLSLFLSLY